MHPQLTAALQRLEAVTRELQDATSELPVSLRARKPAPDRWSINDVLEHVSMVEQLFIDALLPKIQSASPSASEREGFEPAMLPEHVQAVVEDRSRPRMAPEHVHPTGNVDAAASLQTIDNAHARLRDALQSTDSYTLSTVTHDHRIFGTLNTFQWVDLMAGHERRHLQQIREIAAQIAAS